MFDVNLPFLTLRDYCTPTHCGIYAETMYCAALTYRIKKMAVCVWDVSFKNVPEGVRSLWATYLFSRGTKWTVVDFICYEMSALSLYGPENWPHAVCVRVFSAMLRSETAPDLSDSRTQCFFSEEGFDSMQHRITSLKNKFRLRYCKGWLFDLLLEQITVWDEKIMLINRYWTTYCFKGLTFWANGSFIKYTFLKETFRYYCFF